ncbi:amino acid ABC transporter substrate-binding protein (plasmid) [Pseudoalteromonas sp. T1lg65]|uniref:amino acid ABC transporter substrate-binding protein n=1 Tax=Pseudoalteromonas sp. T1lg65 TaxID=2077101 RepID=UPI003F7A6D35
MVWDLIKAATLFFLLSVQASLAATEIRFCYEDKHAPPFVHHSSMNIPQDNPGLSIELVQLLNKQLINARFVFIRKPWQRCLNDLKHGDVDVVIASHLVAREAYMVFPMTSDAVVDESLAVNKIATCLLKHKDKLFLDVSADIPATVALPRGYAAKERLSKEFKVLETDSFKEATALVDRKLVDATIGLCQIDNTKVQLLPPFDKLKASYPPLDITYGYLAFSKAFYDANPLLAAELWKLSEAVDMDELYLNYQRKQPVSEQVK